MSTPANPTVDKFGRTIVKVDYSPAGPANQVGFEFSQVQPPSLVYIQADDRIICQAATSQTGEAVTFNLRILLPNGRIEEEQFTMRPANGRVTITQAFQVSEGYLISLSATASVALTRGMTFARAFINRPIFGASAPAQMIFADYVTTLVSSGYPNGRILAPVEGPGNIYMFNVANPVAGADWVQNVPNFARWRVRGWTAILTTSAAAGNRQVNATVNGGGANTWFGPALANVAASLGVAFSATGMSPYTPANTAFQQLPLPPDLVITGGSGIVQNVGTSTTGILAGDQWSGIHILVEEWLDNV